MSKSVKLGIDIIGILISLAGFGLLVANEKYLVAGALFLLLLALIVYAFVLSFSKPYKVKSVLYEYEFIDSGPNLTKVTKTTVFIPKEKNITKFDDPGIGAEGKIKDIASNKGTCIDRKSGGAVSVTTIFDAPLPVNKEYMHKLSYMGEQCFPEASENVVFTIINKMDKAIVLVRFHAGRRPSNLTAIYKRGSVKKDITDSHLEVNNLEYKLEYKNPDQGSIFELKWEW